MFEYRDHLVDGKFLFVDTASNSVKEIIEYIKNNNVDSLEMNFVRGYTLKDIQKLGDVRRKYTYNQ